MTTAAQFNELLVPTGAANEDPQIAQNFIEGFVSLIATPKELDELLKNDSSAEKEIRIELINVALVKAPKEIIVQIFYALWDWDKKNVPRVCSDTTLDWLMSLAIFLDLSPLLLSDPQNSDVPCPGIQTILASNDQKVIQNLIEITAATLSEENINVLREFAKLDEPDELVFTNALTSFSEEYADDIQEIIELLEEEGLINTQNARDKSEAFKRASVNTNRPTEHPQAVRESINRQHIINRASVKRNAIIKTESRPTSVNPHGAVNSFRNSVKAQQTIRGEEARKTSEHLRHIICDEQTVESLKKIKKHVSSNTFTFHQATFVKQFTEVNDVSYRLTQLGLQPNDATARLRIEIIEIMTNKLLPNLQKQVKKNIGGIFEALKNAPTTNATDNTQAHQAAARTSSVAQKKREIIRGKTQINTEIMTAHDNLYIDKKRPRPERKTYFFTTVFDMVNNGALNNEEKAELYQNAAKTQLAKQGMFSHKLADAFEKCAANPENAINVSYRKTKLK